MCRANLFPAPAAAVPDNVLGPKYAKDLIAAVRRRTDGILAVGHTGNTTPAAEKRDPPKDGVFGHNYRKDVIDYSKKRGPPNDGVFGLKYRKDAIDDTEKRAPTSPNPFAAGYKKDLISVPE